MKLLLILQALGLLGLASADIASLAEAAGARDPKYEYPPSNSSGKVVFDLVQSALFTQYVEAEFLAQGIRNFSSFGGYGPKTLETLKRIKAVVDYDSAIEVAALERNGVKAVKPCKYTFPVTKFTEWVSFARLLFNIRISYETYLVQVFGKSDPRVALLAASSSATVGRWDAFLRGLNGFIAFEDVFTTPLNAEYLYNIDRILIVPGSCPTLPPIVYDLPSWDITERDVPNGFSIPPDFVFARQLYFAWDPKEIPQAKLGAKLYVAWFNQISKPEFTSLDITSPGNGKSKRPKDVYGTVYAIMVNSTSALDIDSVLEYSLSRAVFIGGPFKKS